MIEEPGIRWTRTGYLLGLAVLTWAGFMAVQLSKVCGSCELPGGLTKPMLAMELANNRYEVDKILSVDRMAGCTLLCRKKTDEMRVQQYYDLAFIVLYTAFYLYFAALNFRFGGPLGWALGLGIVGLTLAGARFDWMEDKAILQALKSDVVEMRHPAYLKWLSLTIATGLASPLFARWPTPSVALKLVRLGIVYVALSAAISGILGATRGQDVRVESASVSLASTLLLSVLFLWTVQFWREGTHAGLDRIASLPILHLIADWPPDETPLQLWQRRTLKDRLGRAFTRRSPGPPI